MVQAQQKKHEQNGSTLDARLENVMREVDSLPTTMLPIVLRRIADRMDQQDVDNGNTITKTLRQMLQEIEPKASIYQTLKAQGGPYAEMISLLEKGQLSDDEAQHLRELGHQQAIGLLADWRPAPTDEEVERVLNERVMERYGR